MRFAKGGYLPDPPDDNARRPKLEPGEYIIFLDGTVWQVNDDGTAIIQIVSAEED